jgi:hypothetical protein
MLALALGDLDLAQEAAEETVETNVASDPERFYKELGGDAFFKLVGLGKKVGCKYLTYGRTLASVSGPDEAACGANQLEHGRIASRAVCRSLLSR